MPWPRKTSTCRSFVPISSGLCRLFAIVVLRHGQIHTSRWTRSMAVDHPEAPEQARAGSDRQSQCRSGRVPLRRRAGRQEPDPRRRDGLCPHRHDGRGCAMDRESKILRSEEHTSELQSRENLVCRLLLEKKKKKKPSHKDTN